MAQAPAAAPDSTKTAIAVSEQPKLPPNPANSAKDKKETALPPAAAQPKTEAAAAVGVPSPSAGSTAAAPAQAAAQPAAEQKPEIKTKEQLRDDFIRKNPEEFFKGIKTGFGNIPLLEKTGMGEQFVRDAWKTSADSFRDFLRICPNHETLAGPAKYYLAESSFQHARKTGGQYEAAQKEFKAYLEAQPKGEFVKFAHSFQCAAALELGKPAEAEQSARAALGLLKDSKEQGDTDIAAYTTFNLARALQQQGPQDKAKNQEAIELYTKLIELPEYAVVAQLNRGLCCYRSGEHGAAEDYAKGIKDLEQLAAGGKLTAPDQLAEAKYTIGLCRIGQKDYAGAGAILLETATALPQWKKAGKCLAMWSECESVQARNLADQGKFKEAIEHSSAVLAKEKDLVDKTAAHDALAARGWAQFQSGNYGEAVKDLAAFDAQAAKGHPLRELALRALAAANAHLDVFSESQKYMERLSVDFPQSSELKNTANAVAEIALKGEKKDYLLAEAMFKKSENLAGLGYVQIMLGKNKEAIETLNQFLKNNPKDSKATAEVQNNLKAAQDALVIAPLNEGQKLEQEGKKAEAIAAYIKAMENSPTKQQELSAISAGWNAVGLLEAGKQTAEADKLLDAMNKLFPTSAEHYKRLYNHAAALRNEGIKSNTINERAVSLFERVAKESGDPKLTAEAEFMAAEDRFFQGKYDAARDVLSRLQGRAADLARPEWRENAASYLAESELMLNNFAQAKAAAGAGNGSMALIKAKACCGIAQSILAAESAAAKSEPKNGAEQKQNKYDDARKEFEEAIVLVPGRDTAARAIIGIGDSYAAEQDYTKAVASYQRVMVECPSQPHRHFEALLRLSAVAEAQGRKPDYEAIAKTYSEEVFPAAKLPQSIAQEFSRLRAELNKKLGKTSEGEKAGAAPGAVQAEPAAPAAAAVKATAVSAAK